MNETDLSFCPRCGAKTRAEGKNLRICPKCHLKNYTNPRPCNAVIFYNKKGEILMVKRRLDPQKNKWDLPGGFINPNETLEESVKREIQEELTLSLKGFTYLASYIDTYLFENVRYSTLCFVFSMHFDTKNVIRCADDAASYGWFKQKNIPTEDIAFDGIRRALKDYFTR